jgi:hypothetical protein
MRTGDAHGLSASASTLHSNVAFGSFEEKITDTSPGATEPLGARSIATRGGVASTIQVRRAGVASTAPSEALARTSNACEPSVRALNTAGDAHSSHGPASSRHSKERTSVGAWKWTVAVRDVTTPEGAESMTVSMGAASEPGTSGVAVPEGVGLAGAFSVRSPAARQLFVSRCSLIRPSPSAQTRTRNCPAVSDGNCREKRSRRRVPAGMPGTGALPNLRSLLGPLRTTTTRDFAACLSPVLAMTTEPRSDEPVLRADASVTRKSGRDCPGWADITAGPSTRPSAPAATTRKASRTLSPA